MNFEERETMNIIKIGGSIINPDGKYDSGIINELISLIKNNEEKYIFVIGGGKLCRKVQDASTPYLKEALGQEISYAKDALGIAVTKINANYVLNKFQKKLGKEVHPEILEDPHAKINSKSRIFFIGGYVPGHSTDQDMIVLAKTYNSKKIIKISNFDIVKKIYPLEFQKLSDEEKKKNLAQAQDLPQMTWKELKELVETKWIPGLNTPFDPRAVESGYKLRKKLTLNIGRLEQLPQMLKREKFRGTVVKG